MKILYAGTHFTSINPVIRDCEKDAFEEAIYQMVRKFYPDKFRVYCPTAVPETPSEEHLDVGIIINIRKMLSFIYDMGENYVPVSIAAHAAKAFAHGSVCNTYRYGQWVKSMDTAHYCKPLSEHSTTTRKERLFGAGITGVCINRRGIKEQACMIPEPLIFNLYTTEGCAWGSYVNMAKYVYDSFYTLGGRIAKNDWYIPVIYIHPYMIEGFRKVTNNIVATQHLVQAYINAIFTMMVLNTDGELTPEFGMLTVSEERMVLMNIWDAIDAALYDNDVLRMRDAIKEASIMVTHYPHEH